MQYFNIAYRIEYPSNIDCSGFVQIPKMLNESCMFDSETQQNYNYECYLPSNATLVGYGVEQFYNGSTCDGTYLGAEAFAFNTCLFSNGTYYKVTSVSGMKCCFKL